MDVRSRLESRDFIEKLTKEAAELHFAKKIEKANKNRLKQKIIRAQSAHKQSSRAQSVLREKIARQAENIQAMREKLISRHLNAERRRNKHRDEKVRICKKRSDMLTMVHDRRSLKAQNTRKMINSNRFDADVRREKRFKTMIDRLVAHLERVEFKRTEVKAVRCIQRWFRALRELRKAFDSLQKDSARDINHISILFADLESASFEAAMELLQDMKNTVVAKRFLANLPISSAMSIRPQRMRTSRVFLMAGMISFHAKNVLDVEDEDSSGNTSTDEEKRHRGQLSNNLIWASKLVVKSIHELQKALLIPKVALRKIDISFKNLDATRTLYIDCFNAWKCMDGEKLSGDLIQGYAQLYATNFSTILEHGNNEIEDRIHEIILRTKQQLQQLREAIYKVLGKEPTDIRLRQLEANIEQQVSAKHREKMRKEKQHEEIRAARNYKQARRKEKAAKEPDLGFTRSVFSNDELAHELILNPMYQLEKPPAENHPAASLVERVQTSMKKAYWEQLIDSIKRNEPEGHRRLKDQIAEMRDALLSVLGTTTNDAQEVKRILHNECLDANIAENISWEWVWEIFIFTLKMIVTNEAPARTDSTHTWISQVEEAKHGELKLDILSEICEFVYEKIDFLRFDSVNAHLRILAPYLQRHGVEHERTKLAEKLSQNPNAFANTQRWLTVSINDYYSKVEASTRRDLHQFSAKAFSGFLLEAFISLIKTHIEGGDPSLWPETFCMDVNRIRHLRDEVDTITLQASFVAVLKQTISKSPMKVPFTDPEAFSFCNKLHLLLSDSTVKLPDISAQVVEEARGLMKKVDKHLLEIDASVLEGQVNDIMQPGNPIFKLFFSRVISHIGLSLSHQIGVRTEPKKLSHGLHLFETSLGDVVRDAYRLFTHNESVHASLYNTLTKAALAQKSPVEID